MSHNFLRMGRLWLAYGVFLCSGLSHADTLKLSEKLDGEHLTNKIWVALKTPFGVEYCRSWTGSCDKNGNRICSKKPCEVCRSCQVTYLGSEERKKRKLSWDKKTERWLDYKGKPYDTEQERAKRTLRWDPKKKLWLDNYKGKPYDTKKEQAQGMFLWDETTKQWLDYVGNPYDAEGLNSPKNMTTVFDLEARMSWKSYPGIWVMDTLGNLYVSVEQSPGRFHHSSFLAGGLVEGAGQIVMVQGRIQHINNASGHYLPDRSSFDEMLPKLHLPASASKPGEGIVEYAKDSSEYQSPTKVRIKDRAPSAFEKPDPSFGFLMLYDIPATDAGYIVPSPDDDNDENDQ